MRISPFLKPTAYSKSAFWEIFAYYYWKDTFTILERIVTMEGLIFTIYNIRTFRIPCKMCDSPDRLHFPGDLSVTQGPHLHVCGKVAWYESIFIKTDISSQVRRGFVGGVQFRGGYLGVSQAGPLLAEKSSSLPGPLRLNIIRLA